MEIISSEMGVPHHKNHTILIDRYRIKLKAHSRMIKIGEIKKFYLNLPEMEFWIQFYPSLHIEVVNLFLHNGCYYSSMFLNRLSDFCDIGSFCMGKDYNEKDFQCDRISICKEMIGLFFNTKFNFAGSSLDVIRSFDKDNCFKNFAYPSCKILDTYKEWSIKSKLDRNYNIFDDLPGCPISISIPDGIL